MKPDYKLSILGTLLSIGTASTVDPSTCSRQSIAACPTAYDPCCAYVCAEAQVPFKVCSPTTDTVLAQCSKCPFPTSTSALDTTTKTSEPPVSSPPTTTSPSTLSTSTCTPYVVTTGPACPAAHNPCCAWTCAEAQVPYAVCQPTDNSGQYAVCSQCPTLTL